MASQKNLRSDIAWSTSDAIGVHGYDLCSDLMGEVNFGDMAYLEVTGRLPGKAESRMFNAILVTLVEHGIVPSTLAARMTYAGAPEAMQAAVAAGLLGLGSVFVGSTEGAAKLLAAALPMTSVEPDGDQPIGVPAADLASLATEIVQSHKDAKKFLPGLGHPIHKPVDPRTLRLFAIAEETGFKGRYVELMQHVSEAASQAYGKPLPINATGAIGALCCELGLSWKVSHGLGVMARAVGLVGHVLEEAEQPIAMEIWHRSDEEATRHSRGKLRG
jgi:citrate synthase